MKTRFKYVLKNQTGPNDLHEKVQNTLIIEEIENYQLDIIDLQKMRSQSVSDAAITRQIVVIQDEQQNLLEELPLSNFGPDRTPNHITPELIIGQAKKRKINRTKKEQKEHIMLK
jgi:hypothetical protein